MTADRHNIERAAIRPGGHWTRAIHHEYVGTLEYVLVLPTSDEVRGAAPGEHLAVYDPGNQRELFRAPIAALCDRYIRLTALDDYFGARALWFVAKDLTDKLSEEPVAALQAMATYLAGVRSEWARYAGSVMGVPALRPLQPNTTVEFHNLSKIDITIEVGISLRLRTQRDTVQLDPAWPGIARTTGDFPFQQPDVADLQRRMASIELMHHQLAGLVTQMQLTQRQERAVNSFSSSSGAEIRLNPHGSNQFYPPGGSLGDADREDDE